jgi:hypothetical protein
MGVGNRRRRQEKAKRRADRLRRQASRRWAGDGLDGHIGGRRPASEPRIREALWALAGIGSDRRAGDDDLEVLATAGFAQVASVAQ